MATRMMSETRMLAEALLMGASRRSIAVARHATTVLSESVRGEGSPGSSPGRLRFRGTIQGPQSVVHPGNGARINTRGRSTEGAAWLQTTALTAPTFD